MYVYVCVYTSMYKRMCVYMHQRCYEDLAKENLRMHVKYKNVAYPSIHHMTADI